MKKTEGTKKVPSAMAVAWLPWSAEAFARAQAERKPVLLSIVTAWCRHCAEMDRTSYADPAAAELIERAFVPVRVDADCRPDVSSRYTLGGWPTTAFLSPSGAILGGGTFVAPDVLPGVLARAADAFASRGVELDSGGSPPVPGGSADPGPAPTARAIATQVLALFDPETGTFGGPEAFPHTAPISVALDMFRRDGDRDAERIAVAALDALGWGGLYDEAGGGFFRCARGPGFADPSREKLLEVNAALVLLFVEAAQTLGIDRYAQRARDTMRYLLATLASADGWAASETDGRVNPAIYTDTNAAAACAALAWGGFAGDDGVSAEAIRLLERVFLQVYHPGRGVAHGPGPGLDVRGLLADQVAVIHAQLAAHETTGNVVYEMMAEELSHYLLRAFADDSRGGFVDRVPGADDVGLLRESLRPFATNCEAARALARVARASGESSFLAAAEAALTAIGPSASPQGADAAYYALALREAGRG